MCPFTRLKCPNGLHAWELCGNGGHGAEDCRTHGAQPRVVPSTPKPSSSSVFVPGFGRKGEGKDANYGLAIAPPTEVKQEELPLILRCFRSPRGEAPQSPPRIPTPIPAISEEVEEWMSSGFRQLTNISTKCLPEGGDSVLWRGV